MLSLVGRAVSMGRALGPLARAVWERPRPAPGSARLLAALSPSASASPSPSHAPAPARSLDDTVAEICQGDAELEKRLRVLMLEVEVMRQDGRTAPSQMTTKHWKNLLLRDNKSQRIKYLMYLFKCEKTTENLKAKKEARRIERETKPREVIKEYPDDIEYGLQENALFLRIRDSTINDFDNYKALQAMIYGQSIVLDCSYDDKMVHREALNAAKQLTFVFGDNRIHPDPFNLHLCNVNMKSHTMEQLKTNIPTLLEPWFPLNIHEESYTEIFPKEKIVYLTPHCREELSEFDNEAIYIVGCMVDKTNNEPLSLAKAKRDGIRMARLPLERYIEWAPGSGKCLNINHMALVLLDLKLTGDWEYALRHVPRRKLMETKLLAFRKNSEKYNLGYQKTLKINLNTKPKFTPRKFNDRRIDVKGLFSENNENKY